METFNLISDLLKQQIDFVNDDLELLVENLMEASGKTQAAALVVDQSKGDTDVTEKLEGLTELAGTVGTAFHTLTDDQKAKLKSGVSKLVSYPDNPVLEGGLEGVFNGYVDLIDAGNKLNDFVAAQNA